MEVHVYHLTCMSLPQAYYQQLMNKEIRDGHNLACIEMYFFPKMCAITKWNILVTPLLTKVISILKLFAKAAIIHVYVLRSLMYLWTIDTQLNEYPPLYIETCTLIMKNSNPSLIRGE